MEHLIPAPGVDMLVDETWVLLLWSTHRRSGKEYLSCNLKNKCRVKIENTRGESALGMEGRDHLPEITGEERPNCKKKKYSGEVECSEVLKQKTGDLRK